MALFPQGERGALRRKYAENVFFLSLAICFIEKASQISSFIQKHTMQMTKIGNMSFNYQYHTDFMQIHTYVHKHDPDKFSQICISAESTSLFLATFAWNGNIKSTF